MRKRTMSKAGKITAAISGAFLLLIVVAIILIATVLHPFCWTMKWNSP